MIKLQGQFGKKYYDECTLYFPFELNTDNEHIDFPIWVCTENKHKAVKWIEKKKALWKTIPANRIFAIKVKTEKYFQV